MHCAGKLATCLLGKCMVGNSYMTPGGRAGKLSSLTKVTIGPDSFSCTFKSPDIYRNCQGAYIYAVMID